MNASEPYLRAVSLKRDDVASYDTYPFSIPAVRELHGLEFHPDVTFIVGENGCGKSTLLEGIAAASPRRPCPRRVSSPCAANAWTPRLRASAASRWRDRRGR